MESDSQALLTYDTGSADDLSSKNSNRSLRDPTLVRPENVFRVCNVCIDDIESYI
jgi:hypothetical protein